MILDSLDEIRRQGVRVYDYRTAEERGQPVQGGTQQLDVSRFTLSPWARWIAADRGGDVFEYESPPVLRGNVWIKAADRIDRLGHIDMSDIDWRQTLTPVNHAAPKNGPSILVGENGFAVLRPDDTAKSDDMITIDWRQTLTPLAMSVAPVDVRIADAVATIAQLTQTECEELARQLVAAMGSERTLQLCAALDDAVVCGQAQPAGVIMAHTSYDAQADMLIVYNGSKRVVLADNDEYMLQAAAMQ